MSTIACFFLAGAVGLASGGSVAGTDPPLVDARARLEATYARQLAELVAWCRTHALDREATVTDSWLPARDPDKLTLFVVGSQGRAAEPPAGADATWTEWNRRFLDLRSNQADALWQITVKALDAGRFALALQLATATVREDPNHADARQMLGYEEIDGAWYTDFARRKMQRGYVWHERFGWLKKDDVRRYDAGQRRFGSSWIDAEEDARRRQRIRNGWNVQTDHYQVTTDHSLEEGVRLAVQLERFHQIWCQVFAGYSLDGRHSRGQRDRRSLTCDAGRQHAIYHFRTRDEYNDVLRRQQPRIESTLGIYFDKMRRGYFFAGSDQSAGTLYHEGTHQLFHETRRVAKRVGRDHNFWIVEGIATYMESLTEHRGYWTLGGLDAGRLPAARHRLLENGYYVPLAQLTRMGVDDLQQRDDLGKLYSQSAGLVTFLMHHDAGRYRSALVKYLVAVYTDTADADALARLTGQSYAELDRQYRAFLERG